MNHTDELYGQQWNEQMQQDHSRYEHLRVNHNWFVHNTKYDKLDDIHLEMKMYLEHLENK